MPKPSPQAEKRARIVETMGLLTEAEGMSRIMGRIFGFLLLCEEAQSLDDMAVALNVSKASISTDARRLEDMGFLMRVSRPGDRRDYYELAGDFMERSMRRQIEKIRKLRDAMREAQDGLEASTRIRQRLHDFETVFDIGIASLERDLDQLETATARATRRNSSTR